MATVTAVTVYEKAGGDRRPNALSGSFVAPLQRWSNRTSVEPYENMAAQELRTQIREAFPATQFYGPITSCDCDECTRIREELRHKRWNEISTAFLDLTCSPTLLTPEAFNAFSPAYLFRALDNLDQHSVVLEFTVYSLCPHKAKKNGKEDQVHEEGVCRLLQRVRLMSPEQIQAIRAFLVFVLENAGDAEWLRPFITGALETVWQ